MNQKHIYVLLKLIKNNSSIKILLREGVTYQRIAELTNELIMDRFLILRNEKVSLSESGIVRLKELELLFKKTNKEEWIEKDTKNMIPKLDKNFIFIPDQNELSL